MGIFSKGFLNIFANMASTRRMWLIVVFLTLCTSVLPAEPRVVCYYTNWSVYRPGTARFNPQNINPYLCTHLVYAFGGFTKENSLKPFDKYQDIEKGGYAKFTGLKTYNKNLKTLLAIGGWNEGSSRFSPMVASRERRKEFVKNVIKFLRQNRFDGLDLDWEYPAFRDGSKPKDRENYAKLVKELREEFDREAEKTNRPRLLLTMAVPAGIEYIEKGFDVKTLNRYLDWMNLLSYDYHSAFEPAVNHHAPLYPLEEPNEYSVDSELNIDYTINFYLEKGADPDKLVLGIPTYGRSYTLFNPDATEIGAPADGPGEQGEATREKGYLAYYEICESLKPKKKKRNAADAEDDSEETEEASDEKEEDEPWTVFHPNPNAMGPVAYKGNQWVGYDDIEIVRKKAEYVAEKGLGGIMFWSIDNDDFRGNCHGKPYPLIEAAKEAYISKLGSTDNAITERTGVSTSTSRRRNRPRVTTTTTTTAKPSTAAKTQSNKRKNTISTTPSWVLETPEPPTTPDPGADFKCTDEGFFPHPRDCKKYFWCLDSGPSNLGIVAHQFTCPSGLFFNKAADSCDFARNVLCKKPAATTKAPATRKPTTTTTTSTTTTTRRPIKLTSKSASQFRTTTTSTTTTESPEPAKDEVTNGEADAADIDAEDPKVIKELIELIKKVGGVEQLEKQLRFAEGSSTSTGNSGTTTPSSFNKKLYQKVLERTRSKNKFGGNTIDGPQNSRSGPQNAGLENVREIISARKERPKYTTINRSRPNNVDVEEAADPNDESSSVEEPRLYVQRSRSRAEDEGVKVATSARPLQYVNIRRARPTTISSTSDTPDDTASRYSLFERSEPLVSVVDTSNVDITNTKRESSLDYVTIRRQRPTTEEATTLPYSNTEQQESLETIEKEALAPSTQPQYTSIVRARSTTVAPAAESFATPEPTTVLTVQISSLLNSPSSEDSERIPTESDVSITTTAVSETSSTTTTMPTTTTTTTTEAPVRSTSNPRRTVFRRRGSTTTSTPTSSTISQVSSERAYTNVRRKRPLSQSNEISLDKSENNKIEIPRRIRSTTPDSREIESVNKNEGISRQNRYRNRFSQTIIEDSVAAAASPSYRGQYRPTISRDELISLTPIDKETPTIIRDTNTFKSERRYRGRSSTTTADELEDSEASAATIETRTPSIIPRNRSRFGFKATNENVKDSSNTESESKSRRPTFGKFTPRPFISKTKEYDINYEEIDEESQTNQGASTRIPFRLPFEKTRPTQKISGSLQGRKAPFPLNGLNSTPNSITEQKKYEVDENKSDDISLSESAIEEKEHEMLDSTSNEETSKKPVMNEEIQNEHQRNTINLSTSNDFKSNLGLQTGKQRKLKIIRRRPTTSTSAPDNLVINSTDLLKTSSLTPGVQRIRKILRKKIIPSQNAPEDEMKSLQASEVFAKFTTEENVNYGEKSKVVSTAIFTTTSTSTTEKILVEFKNKDEPEIVKSSEDTENIESNGDIEDEEKDYDKNNKNEDFGIESIETTEVNIQNNSEVKAVKEDKKIPLLSENKEIAINENISIEKDTAEDAVEKSESQEVPTTKSTTTITSTARSRLPYRPPKRLFTSTTEPSITFPSRTYSRKYNIGAYTSPITIDKFSESTRSPIKRPLYTSRPFTRKPSTTLSTTQNLDDDDEEEEEEYSEEEEILDEEPESPLVLVPLNKLFTRKPNKFADEEKSEEVSSEITEEKGPEEEITNQPTRKPLFKPKVVNSNTFRTSTTTGLPKRQFESTQNRTAIFSRLGNPSNVNDTKKRVQNVPVGYNNQKSSKVTTTTASTIEQGIIEETTMALLTETQANTDDEDYLTVSDVTETSTFENSTNMEETTLNEINTESTSSQIEFDIDDYLEIIDNSTVYPSTINLNTENESLITETTTSQFSEVNDETTILTKVDDDSTEMTLPETTTNIPQVSPIVKTQFDKLFSVSRVVEVSSKLDKRRLNKYNESKLIESGNVVQVKKPTENKIGEVSRFSLIKILENEIPIYLTKLGHVYPVENPPNNPIRIDEARNARALKNFADVGKENLIASESINEAYRHVNNISPKSSYEAKDKERVERLSDDDFLTHVNENSKSEESVSNDYQPFPMQWQFIPAAYDSEKYRQNVAAKSFQIITPRHQVTEPSTLSLEGLFKTESPMLVKAKNLKEDNRRQPFVVYSGRSVNGEDVDLVKFHIFKPEAGRSIKTYVRGQEFDGGSSGEETMGVKNPIDASVVSETVATTKESTTIGEIYASTTVMSNTVTMIDGMTTRNSEDMTTTATPVFTTDSDLLTISGNDSTTTESSVQETTTFRAARVSNDALSENAKRRPKLAFPRRPTIFKTSNLTQRNSSALISPKNPNKINKSHSSRINQNANKTTTGFNPAKSRFSTNRAQNVPVDIKSKKPSPKIGSRSNPTEPPKVYTTTERKPYFKPIRPNFQRPVFVPRKSLQPTTVTHVSNDN